MNPTSTWGSLLFAAAMVMGMVKMITSWRKKQRELAASVDGAQLSGDDRVRHLLRTGRDIQAHSLYARNHGTTEVETEVAIRAIKRELGMP